MIKILDIYIARTLFTTTALSLSVLTGLSSLIKFIEQMKSVGRGSYDMSVAAIYVLLSVPRDFEQFFPMATLIGGLIGMGMLASSSELVVMQAAGQSRANIITSAMKSALLMVLVIMAVSEWVAPASETKAKEIRTQAISGGSLFSGDRLVWAKDGDNFVSIGEVASRSQLKDVTIYAFDDAAHLKQITYAKEALFNGDYWLLNNPSFTYFSSDQISSEVQSQGLWRSSLTPDKLSVVTVKPDALSIQGLLDYINYLENNSQDPSQYELALWRKILQPLTIAAMLLMALSFIFGPLRSVTMGARIIMGVLTGFGFFVANEVFGPLSLVYQLPSVLGAIAPSLLFAGVAMYMLRR